MKDFNIGINLVKALKYNNDTVTPNRICIIDEDNLPSCIDVYTNNFGSKNCACRYVPERKHGKWIFDDRGFTICSNCLHKALPNKYCPHCGSQMKH